MTNRHFLRRSFASCFVLASLAIPSIAMADESAPATAEAPKTIAPGSAGRGFVLTFGSGLSYLGGDLAKTAPIGAAQLTFDVRIGGYFTERFGVMAGVQGGYGAMFEGCSSTCSNAFSYQIPIVAQYSLRDRRRGVYFEGGLGLLSTYGGSSGKDASSPEALEVVSPVDLKLGIGYRFARIDPTSAKDTTTGVDMRLGMDVGQFDRVEYHSVDGSVDGDIRPEMKAMHFAFGLSVGYHFTP